MEAARTRQYLRILSQCLTPYRAVRGIRKVASRENGSLTLSDSASPCRTPCC